MDKIHRNKDKPKFLKCQFVVKQKTFDQHVNFRENKLPIRIRIGVPNSTTRVILASLCVDLKSDNIENVSFTFQDHTLHLKTSEPRNFVSKVTNILLDNVGAKNANTKAEKVVLITDSYYKLKRFIEWASDFDEQYVWSPYGTWKNSILFCN